MKRVVIVLAGVLVLGGYLARGQARAVAPVPAQADRLTDTENDLDPMADCCRLIVRGCGKQAKVCVGASCSIATQNRARKAFESAYRCNSSSVSSYIGTCSGEQCDIDLR